MDKILYVDDRIRGHPLDRVTVERSMRGGICSKDVRVAQVALERKELHTACSTLATEEKM